MKPIDFRNETFAQVQERVVGARAAVLAAFQAHGPCTTKELAEVSGLSILTLRPRTTELVELGLVILAEGQSAKGEGIYRAATHSEAILFFNQSRRRAERPAELPLLFTT
jgi:DNA-binding MarR family transcriptional regulator